MLDGKFKTYNARKIILNKKEEINEASKKIHSDSLKKKCITDKTYIVINLETSNLDIYCGKVSRKLYFPETSDLLIPCAKEKSFDLYDFLKDSYVLQFFDIMCKKQNK